MASNKVAETKEQKEAREMVETIATNIAKLSRQAHELLNGRLKKNAVVVLLSNATQLPKATISKVLDAVDDMEAEWLQG